MAKKQNKYGEKIDLVLQQRLANPPGQPYYCLRWWTYYPGSPENYRRFYKYKGKFWTIPVEVALRLIREARDRGMLGAQYDNDSASFPAIIDSRLLPERKRQRVSGEIICNEGEPDWGANPTFLISEKTEDAGIWREMMIVDGLAEICTFRSTTTFSYAAYNPAANAPGIYPPWRIDNTMQEVNPALMRECLHCLEEISG